VDDGALVLAELLVGESGVAQAHFLAGLDEAGGAGGDLEVGLEGGGAGCVWARAGWAAGWEGGFVA
jgi:hypothetical protein